MEVLVRQGLNRFEVIRYLNEAGYLYFKRHKFIEVVLETKSIFIYW